MTESGVRVRVALDRATEYRTMFLIEPDRFVVDLANSRWGLPRGEVGQGPGAGVVRGYRYAPRDGGVARLVLDLSGPATVVRQELTVGPAPSLAFDFADGGFAAAPAPPPLEMSGRGSRRTIVIDAGHGGRDPGAIGATGVREKDVVLDHALQLRAALEARGRYQVALTRDNDNYVELGDRVAFARAQNADLFISVHADSGANAEARGAAVYTLSEGGANRAQNLMASQDWDLNLGEIQRDASVGDILVDLTQRETTNRSAQFAQTLIPRLGRVAPLISNTHRNAGFFVLLAPDVPAVLIETGFLSNVADERRLSDPRSRQALAEAMAGAVDAYFNAPQLYAARA
ncbi:MAG: N-acetylmuramoyl-L-alanine amidase [Terricaulis sp.]